MFLTEKKNGVIIYCALQFVRPLFYTSQFPVRPLTVAMATAFHSKSEDIQRFSNEKESLSTKEAEHQHRWKDSVLVELELMKTVGKLVSLSFFFGTICR